MIKVLIAMFFTSEVDEEKFREMNERCLLWVVTHLCAQTTDKQCIRRARDLGKMLLVNGR